MVAGGVMSLHYSAIVQFNGCPIILANGPAQTGKTTAIRVALSLIGKLSDTSLNVHFCKL